MQKSISIPTRVMSLRHLPLKNCKSKGSNQNPPSDRNGDATCIVIDGKEFSMTQHMPLKKYKRSIDEVESRSGINVMPNLSYNSAQTIESSVYGLRSELGCN